MALSMVDKRGMILSEILLAGAIISIALGSVVIVIGSMQSMLSNAQNSFEAQLKARREISLAHLTVFDDVSSFQKTDGFFSTIFFASYRNDFTTNISADVSWYEGPFQKHRSLADQIVDWKHSAGAADCDWLDNAKDNLSVVNFGSLSADSGNPITDAVALGDFVYVSADSASSSLPDLYVIDVHNIQSPTIVGRLSTGPGIAAIAAAGHYIFAANAGSYQMQTIDVVDPAHPVLVSQAKLPGSVISGSAGFGKSVHFFDNKMFIGLIKNAGPEFYVVDVSDPTSPIALGSYEIGSAVNDIDVQGGSPNLNRAVVVTPGQTSLFLFDVSNPAAISLMASTSLAGWQTQGAQSVEMLGSNIIIGRTLGGFYSPYPELAVLNKGLLFSTTSNLKIGASIENILGFGDHLYMTTSDADKAFQVFQDDGVNAIANGSSSPMPGAPVAVMSVALSSRGVTLTCNSRAMYVVTQNDQDFFHIFSPPQ